MVGHALNGGTDEAAQERDFSGGHQGLQMLPAASLDQNAVGDGFAMLVVGDDAGPGIDVHGGDSLLAKGFRHQPAGEPFAEAYDEVIGPGRQFADRGKAAQNFVDGIEFLLDPVLHDALAVGGEEQGGSVAMTVTQAGA